MSMNGVTSTWGPQGLVADRSLSVSVRGNHLFQEPIW